MNTQHIHQGCTHCACNSPLLKIMGKDLLTEQNIAGITQKLTKWIAPEPESLVITGGTIRPMNGGAIDTVEAIGISAGKLVATGSLASVTEQMESQKIQFKNLSLQAGQTLLPGLIEPHVHILVSAILAHFSDVGPFDGQALRSGYNLDWLKTQLQSQTEKLPRDFWVLGRTVDPALMPFQANYPGNLNSITEIDYTTLDVINNDVPILLLSASMHTAYVNSAALKIVFDKSKSVQEQYTDFETYRQKTNGQLQEEEQISPALKSIPNSQWLEIFDHIFSNLNAFFETAVSRGVTFMYDAGMNEVEKSLLDTYLLYHQSKVRIGAAMICGNADDISKMKQYQPQQDYQDIYIGNIKLVSDGSNQGLTGYQSDDYCCLPKDNHGLFNFPNDGASHPVEIPQEYKDLVKQANSQGWPLMIHANGDRAVQFAIEAYDYALEGQADIAKRHRIEHCSLLNPEEIETMVKLGISPSFLIGHVGYWGYVFRNAIFEEKAETLDLCKSCLDKGLRITLHSDYSVSPVGPLRMMEQAITRIMEADPELKPLNANERITGAQALRAATYDAAWQCHADGWIGSLEVGKFADFVILQQDPLTLEDCYLQMRNIPVLSTWKGGVRVYPSAT